MKNTFPPRQLANLELYKKIIFFHSVNRNFSGVKLRNWLFILTLCSVVTVSGRGIAQPGYQPEQPPAYHPTAAPDIPVRNESHLLKTALPVILSPAPGACLDLQDLEIKWLTFMPAFSFTISLDDLNTNKPVINKRTVYEPFYKITADFLTYGHRYRVMISALDSSGKLTWSYSLFKINILPVLSGLALDMALHENIVWDKCVPELLRARDKLIHEIKKAGWSIYFTSAYRPYELQEHYYLILRNLQDPALDQEDYLKQEKKRHGLGVLVAKPAADAPHVRGAAFDAMVLDSRGRALNGLRFMQPRLLALMQQAGFKAPPPRDCVHFEVDLP